MPLTGRRSPDYLQNLFAYNEWASDRVLNAASAVSSEQLRDEITPGASSPLANLMHVLQAQTSWLSFWRGVARERLPGAPADGAIPWLRNHYERSHEQLQRFVASLDEQEMEYLYQDGEDFHFMNTETYEQIHLSHAVLGDGASYLMPNVKIKVEFYEGNPVGVELPSTVDLTVVETEPGLKSATASNVTKPAKLETGLVVQVPPFISEGEKIRVDTAEGKYLERAK